MPQIPLHQNQTPSVTVTAALDVDLLRRIVEYSPDCIQLIDLDGKLRWINMGGQYAMEIENIEEYAGLNWYALWNGDDLKQARQAAADATMGHSSGFRGYSPTATGKPRWWAVTISAIPDENQSYALLVIARDITEQTQSEAASAQLAAVADNSADAIIGFDSEGRINAWNRGAEQVFGYTVIEAIGQTYALIGTEASRAVQQNIFQDVMQGQSTRRYETQRRRKDGVLLDVSITTSPLRVGGIIQGASAVVRDITEQVRTANELRRRNAMLDTLVQGSGSAIYMKDTQGRFLLANPMCLAVFGKSSEDVLGYDDTRLFEPEIAQTVMRDDAAIMRSGEERVFEECFPIHGKIHTFLSVKNPMFDATGHLLGIIGISTDITERKRYEAEIQELNARLHRAMQEIHHRVKNNLQVISALTEMQGANAENTVPISAMQRIGRHVRALASLHDLLTHQIKADAQDEMISTRDILSKLLFLLQSATKNRPLTYQAEDARLTMEQSSSFAMLVSELVSNAVKHGEGGIELTLTWKLQPEAPGDGERRLLRLEVCDDGPGFPPDFDPVAAASTGLELIDSLARWDLRGVVSYENREERGARVVVTFPVAE